MMKTDKNFLARPAKHKLLFGRLLARWCFFKRQFFHWFNNAKLSRRLGVSFENEQNWM